MGDHYVPQAYLRGFTEPGSADMIWAYDKHQRKLFRTNVVNVAQEKGFYGHEIEQALNAEVETPAHPVLEQIRRRERINAEQRYALSVYITVMLARVPHRRAKVKERLPAEIDKTIQKYIDAVHYIAATTDMQQAVAQKRLRELEDLRARYQAEPPKLVVEQLNTPQPNQKIVQTIYSMVWRFLVADRATRFVTTDNPVFFFECYGFIRDVSEFSLPISSAICLIGNWQPGKCAEQLCDVPDAYVKEMNRRSISNATRFVFHHKRDQRLAELAHKKLDLNRIAW